MFSQPRKFPLVVNLASHQEGYWRKLTAVKPHDCSVPFPHELVTITQKIIFPNVTGIGHHSQTVTGRDDDAEFALGQLLLVQVWHLAWKEEATLATALPALWTRYQDCSNSWTSPILRFFVSPENKQSPYLFSWWVLAASEVLTRRIPRQQQQCRLVFLCQNHCS